MTADGSPVPVWRRPMVARDREETHRASTPLELLFDLCFVVAVAQAAAQLHHGLAVGHVAGSIVGYVMVFFAIWWAWVNFTWFASAYDTDDVPYRLLTMLQIAGVLVLAAGVPAAFDHHDFTAPTIGYVIMRVALIVQWMRVVHDDPIGRPAALRYAVGIGVVQVAWLLRLLLPAPWSGIGFVVLAVCELLIPAWAEFRGARTSWHPHHISERYGLFTLIVIGECVSAATLAVQSSITQGGLSLRLLALAAGGLLLVFGFWWSYFKQPVAGRLHESRDSAFLWAYSHYLIFAAIAATGAGLGVATEVDRIHGAETEAGLAVAVPVAIYLVVLGALHAYMGRESVTGLVLVAVAAVLVLLSGLLAATAVWAAVLLMGVIVAATVTVSVLTHRAPAAT